ncbi:MAG: TPM domain-containing protein [Verrucomicrobiota bacterium]
MKRLWFIVLGLWCATAWCAEVIPPAPADHFNDYANVVSSATAAQLNQKLVDFEKSSSSQILVAVYPKMQSDSPIEDYTVRVAQSWRVGQKAKDNGAVLFVFIGDRKMYLQVGYGLEGAMPDAICKRIIDNEITPRFKAGDYEGGLKAGVTAILAAAKGEYKGTGRTVAEGGQGYRQRSRPIPFTDPAVIIIVIGICFVLLPIAIRRGILANRGSVLGGRGSFGSGSFWSGGGFGGGGGFG